MSDSDKTEPDYAGQEIRRNARARHGRHGAGLAGQDHRRRSMTNREPPGDWVILVQRQSRGNWCYKTSSDKYGVELTNLVTRPSRRWAYRAALREISAHARFIDKRGPWERA